jgi:hypothetical protein
MAQTTFIHDAVTLSLATGTLPDLEPTPAGFVFHFPELSPAEAARVLGSAEAARFRAFHTRWREVRRAMELTRASR